MSDRTEHDLRAALARAPVGIGLWDRELRYRWVNETLAQINALPAELHIGRTIPDVVPALPDEVLASYRGVLETGVAVHGRVIETETKAEPGHRRSWSVSVFRTTDADGRPDGVASIIEDVTALQASRAQNAVLEDELALERRVLAEVIERVPLGVTLLWGRELRYHVMNEQGRRMLPDRGPLVGRTPAEVYPETSEAFAATVLPLFDSGEELIIRSYPLPFDDDVGALDGLRYYDVTFAPISLEPGTVVGVLVAYVDVTAALRRERELEQELAEERDLSAALQQAILPRRLPVVPHLDVAARYRAAGERYEVGGDFYGLFAARGGSWLAVVGDVCGKGPRAAARTSMVRYCLRAEAAHADDPVELLERLNAEVRRELVQQQEEDFVTVVLAILRPTPTGTDLLVATAAHPAAIIAAPDGSWRTLGGPGLPVGVTDAPQYDEHVGRLAPGERLVLHTDGLLDAHAPKVMLTTADLAARAAVPGGAEDVADAVLHHVTASAVPARDDCALLVLAQHP